MAKDKDFVTLASGDWDALIRAEVTTKTGSGPGLSADSVHGKWRNAAKCMCVCNECNQSRNDMHDNPRK
jgi:hypothetical protein